MDQFCFAVSMLVSFQPSKNVKHTYDCYKYVKNVFRFVVCAFFVPPSEFLFLAHFFFARVCFACCFQFGIYVNQKSLKVCRWCGVFVTYISRKTYKLKNSPTSFSLLPFSRNDELFRKYKSMSLATLCHNHIFTANTYTYLDVCCIKEWTKSNAVQKRNWYCVLPVCQFEMKCIWEKRIETQRRMEGMEMRKRATLLKWAHIGRLNKKKLK